MHGIIIMVLYCFPITSGGEHSYICKSIALAISMAITHCSSTTGLGIVVAVLSLLVLTAGCVIVYLYVVIRKLKQASAEESQM